MPPDPPNLTYAASNASHASGDSGTFPRLVRASVIVGANETPYLRLGQGAPTIFLALNSESEGGHEWTLVSTLAATRRVIVVDSPTRCVDSPPFATWLLGLLDGLGIARAALVAPDVHALQVLHFALSHADRAERLVLLADEEPGVALPIVGTVSPDGAATDVPVLIIASPSSPLHRLHLPDVVRFVAGGAETRPG